VSGPQQRSPTGARTTGTKAGTQTRTRSGTQAGTHLGPEDVAAEDWAPGDRWIPARGGWSSLEIHSIEDANSPEFERCYARLWAEFGTSGGMEQRDVLHGRLGWRLEPAAGGIRLGYELLALQLEGRLAAVRDHNLVLHVDPEAPDRLAGVVVHLSHAFVDPELRAAGLGGWLRTLPVCSAKRAIEQLGEDASRIPICLVAEMDAPCADVPMSQQRLRRYARAGFRVLDPEAAPYAQPDFRPVAEIERTGARSVPLQLVLRRVGREHEHAISAAEVERIVDSLYTLYAAHSTPVAIDPLRAQARSWLRARSEFALRDPAEL